MKEQTKRAIELIQEHINSNTQSISNNFDYTPKDELLQQNDLYNIAIQTLQNELKRLVGCSWCNRKSCLSCQWNHAGECIDSVKCVSSNSINYKALPFCAGCGKKLKEGE